MSVTLNEVALRALLSAEQGPVMRLIERKGEIARDALQHRINGIIQNPAIQPRAGLEMTPEGAVIGIVDELGRIDQYLDFKLGELEPWWNEGQEEVRGAF